MSELAVVLGMLFFLLCLGLVFLHGTRLGRLALLDWAVLGIFYAQPALVVSGNFDFLASALIIAIFLYMPRIGWRAGRFAPGANHLGREA